VPGGSVETLRSFLNVQSANDFVLVVAWALAVLRNRGPYPVIVLSGEQGSAKSTFSAILRALLDPNTAPLRALPREDRDLFIAASNGHVLAFDNVSGLPAWISDTLCRLATGGGFVDLLAADAPRPPKEVFTEALRLARWDLERSTDAVDDYFRNRRYREAGVTDADRPALLLVTRWLLEQLLSLGEATMGRVKRSDMARVLDRLERALSSAPA